MDLSVYLAYIGAVFLISGTPGPNMLLSMTHGIHHGLRRTLPTMMGLLAGLGIILSISLGGLGALLLTSAKAFAVMKYIGAAYLIYLGVKTWRSKATGLQTDTRVDGGATAWQGFRTGLIVSVFNPKAILFGVAFFPQFIDTSKPFMEQVAILLLSFIVIETGWMFAYASGGAKISSWLQRGNRLKWFNRASGAAFVGAGVLLGSFRR